MSTSKNPSPEPVASTGDHPEAYLPANVIHTEPFFLPTFQPSRRRILPTFDVRQLLKDVPPVETPTDHPAPRPITPRPPSTTPLPRNSQSSPEREGWKTPPESGRTITKIRLVELETSPSPPRSRGSAETRRSGESKRSVDTDGDARMGNAGYTSPEILKFQLREEIRGMVMQSVHDNFEFERSRFADEVRQQLLATMGDEMDFLVRQKVDQAMVAAVAEPEQSEWDAVVLVRERLRRMGDEALVKTFCTEEMMIVLKKLVSIMDLEMRVGSWSMVEAGDEWHSLR